MSTTLMSNRHNAANLIVNSLILNIKKEHFDSCKMATSEQEEGSR